MTTKVKGTEGIEFPDATVQASAALSAFIGANQSLAGNGYQKLPGGLIIQWGYGEGTGDRFISYPIPFPNSVLQVVATMDNSGLTTNQSLHVSLNVSGLTQFNASPRYANDGGLVGVAGQAIRWIAIGH